MEWLTNVVPFAFVAVLCPLMMLLMMRGMHGGHGGHQEHGDGRHAPEDADELASLRDEVAALRAQVGEREDAPPDRAHHKAGSR